MTNNPNPLMLLADSPDTLREVLRPIIQELMLEALAVKPKTSDRLMTVEEVCGEFGISKTTLVQWRKDGKVPDIRLGGRRVYFERSAILEAGRAHAKYQRS
jgi:excisionase family DNA binding protein